MGRNKKLTKAIRERMARTGESYTTARMHLLRAEEKPRFRLLGVHDVEPGTGEVAGPWCTLRVRYTIRRDSTVFDEGTKVYADARRRLSWMAQLEGLREGALRRLDVEFDRWGRCTIEARLLEVLPYEPRPPADMTFGTGRVAEAGDTVCIRTGEDEELTFTLGRGEVARALEVAVLGMREGGERWGDVLLPEEEPAHVWVELLAVYGRVS